MKNLLFGFLAFAFLTTISEAKSLDSRLLFGRDRSLMYFHTHKASSRELKAVDSLNIAFEIDLAWAHSSFNPHITKDAPYIGHPEEFYTKMGKPFPEDNVSLDEFVSFLKSHPGVKVLLDIKDEAVFPYVEIFVKAVGKERCIVHAFIKNWTRVPEGAIVEPHWYREDIDLFALDALLSRLGVPLIANCRGFSDENIKKHDMIAKMLSDSKHCKSVICLGLYYPGVPLPNIEFLKKINAAGYYAWVNGNVEEFSKKIGSIKYIAMQDDCTYCTVFNHI